MRRTDLAEIRAVIRRVRSEQFAHLNNVVLDAILDIEAVTTDDDASALRRIREVLAKLEDRI